MGTGQGPGKFWVLIWESRESKLKWDTESLLGGREQPEGILVKWQMELGTLPTSQFCPRPAYLWRSSSSTPDLQTWLHGNRIGLLGSYQSRNASSEGDPITLAQGKFITNCLLYIFESINTHSSAIMITLYKLHHGNAQKWPGLCTSNKNTIHLLPCKLSCDDLPQTFQRDFSMKGEVSAYSVLQYTNSTKISNYKTCSYWNNPQAHTSAA